MKNFVVVSPSLTEKSMQLQEEGCYVFNVTKNANKISIAKEVEERFDVEVDSVSVLVRKGKNKSQYTKNGFRQGKTSAKKRAFVRLKDGFTIDIVENGLDS
jgi:large subunit ribosomal protein L23